MSLPPVAARGVNGRVERLELRCGGNPFGISSIGTGCARSIGNRARRAVTRPGRGADFVLDSERGLWYYRWNESRRRKGRAAGFPHGGGIRHAGPERGDREMNRVEYKIENLTREDAAYIGGRINEIVPREVDAEEEEFVLKIEDESGGIIGGCIARAYEYHWARMFLDTLWVDERFRRRGIGSVILREVERIAREKGCRVVTLGTASFMARPFYEKHGYTVFTTLKKANGHISYSLVKYLDGDAAESVPAGGGARYKVSFGNEDDAEVIEDGIRTYIAAYEPERESVDCSRKLVDPDGRFAAGVIADVGKGAYGFICALFVEEPLRHRGLGTYFVREVEKLARENGANMILTTAGDWNVGFFRKNGYLLRGELKDVPEGHSCYELYKET